MPVRTILVSTGVIYNNNELNDAMAATAAAKPVALWPPYTPAYWQTVVDRVRHSTGCSSCHVLNWGARAQCTLDVVQHLGQCGCGLLTGCMHIEPP
jgi:hypothetical protein